jgi:hypothetical protein
VPPDPTAMAIASATASATGPSYVEPPADVEVSWSIVNLEIGHTVSIDRQINAEGWDEIATAVEPTLGFYNDTIADFVNRPDTEYPPVTHRVTYRVRVVDGGAVTVLSRTTSSVPLYPV